MPLARGLPAGVGGCPGSGPGRRGRRAQASGCAASTRATAMASAISRGPPGYAAMASPSTRCRRLRPVAGCKDWSEVLQAQGLAELARLLLPLAAGEGDDV